MKKCSVCKSVKPKSEFPFKNSAKGWRNAYCRSCQREYCRAHYQRNGQKHNLRRHENTLIYRKRNQAYLIAYLLNHSCVDCGEDDPFVLEFDHVRGQKRHNIAEIVSMGHSIAYLEDEISKCVVRCANCHRRKTAAQFSWFKSTKLGNTRKRDIVGA